MGAKYVNLEPRKSGETLTTSQRPQVCPLSSEDDLEMGGSREQLTRFLLCSREAARQRHHIISATYCVSNIKKFNEKEIARS